MMAERAGFEPAIQLPVYTLYRRAPSTARPPLRRGATLGRRGDVIKGISCLDREIGGFDELGLTGAARRHDGRSQAGSVDGAWINGSMRLPPRRARHANPDVAGSYVEIRLEPKI